MESSPGAPGGNAFEVVERVADDGEKKERVCYAGFLRKEIAEGVAGMLEGNPDFTWLDIQREFAKERKLCI